MANYYNDMDKFKDLFLYLFPKYIDNIDKINFLGTDYINNNSKSTDGNLKKDVVNTTQSVPKASVNGNPQKSDKTTTSDKVNTPKANTPSSSKPTTNSNSKTNDNKLGGGGNTAKLS
ncbi:hypothetical protein, partial [Clostridium sp. DJ247]|uniref:hypothetical protein n=1 Tax=Clostridium sp. DJ247 TaxID=2726188 RepID=UPI001A9C21FB